MVIMVTHKAEFSKGIDIESKEIKIEISEELKKAHASARGRRRERIFAINYQDKTYYIHCIVLRCKKTGELMLFIPEFIIPRRPFPVFVYLFAISLYCENPGMSQRKAAEATRKEFGLEKFSHTTVGRALKAFVSKLGTKGVESGEAAEADGGEEGGGTDCRGIPSKQATEERRRRALAALPKGLARKSRQLLIDICCRMARARHNKSKCFLL